MTCEADTYASGIASRTMRSASISWSGFRNENRKHIATESTPSDFRYSTLLLRSSTSRSRLALPLESTRSVTPTRRYLGASGSTWSILRLYLSSLSPSLISSRSRNPSVVISPTFAPFLSTSVLVATVVPCMTTCAFSSSPRASIPIDEASPSIPLSTPSDGSSGVVGVLNATGAESPASIATRSVNVPPTSIPILNPRILSDSSGEPAPRIRKLYV